MNTLIQLRDYIPFNAQEEADKSFILSFCRDNGDAFQRTNRVAHMTASSWVVNREHTKVLMVYHNLYNSWSWTGGHADGETDLLEVAIRECCEETGIHSVKPVSNDIYSVEVLTVDGHVKKGEYLSSHLHLNVTFLLEADDNEETVVKEDENSGVAWFGLEEALSASTEPWFVEHIYKKLNDKLSSI